MIRSIDTALELRAEGREVFGRIVPFGVTALIREPDASGQLEEYEEEFLPGCTSGMRQTAARARGGKPNWIRFTLEHRSDEDSRLGYCRSLEERDDGVYALFEIYDDAPKLSKIRSMLSTSHDGLSIEFLDLARNPDTGPSRKRRSIHIDAVSATPVPTYASAEILAVRDDPAGLYAATPNLDRARALLAAL